MKKNAATFAASAGSLSDNDAHFGTLGSIANRAEQLTGHKKINFLLDLWAVKTNIDWQRLLKADDFNFLHDVGGIHKHLDRATGKLKDGFVPRFAL